MFYLSTTLWKLKVACRGVVCFFIGHHEIPGERAFYENDWCFDCFCDWPQDKITLPHLLNRVLVWGIERAWKWLLRFDYWLYWWEY